MRLQRLVLFTALALPLAADEGMWLFNTFPTSTVKEKYAVDVTPQFLEHLRLSSVHIGPATGAGAFVSPNGLILTTRRLIADCLTALGKDAVYAATQSDEL